MRIQGIHTWALVHLPYVTGQKLESSLPLNKESKSSQKSLQLPIGHGSTSSSGPSLSRMLNRYSQLYSEKIPKRASHCFRLG